MGVRLLGRRLPVVIVLSALLLAAPAPAPAAAASAGYHVRGNQIVDSSGAAFIVKGADAVYGRLAGGDPMGYGLRNYQNGPRDLDNLHAVGVNTIRVTVSYNDYSSGALGQSEYLSELDQIVGWVTGRGMVAEISQEWAGGPANVVTFVGLLAARYKDNSLVWIKPDNEPNCNDGDTSKCLDWSYWQSTESRYVAAIRNAGNVQPIVVNCIGWSWDCSQIGSYPLGDANIIYGAHRYGYGSPTFDGQQQAACDFLWANLASSYPMIVDEVGLVVPPASPPAWGAGFLDYATNWVKTRQGSGVIGFVDAWWSNSMTNTDGSWNDWGKTFVTHYWSAF
jgi:Cellulase (glycosyl hydrolase family 5)